MIMPPRRKQSWVEKIWIVLVIIVVISMIVLLIAPGLLSF